MYCIPYITATIINILFLISCLVLSCKQYLLGIIPRYVRVSPGVRVLAGLGEADGGDVRRVTHVAVQRQDGHVEPTTTTFVYATLPAFDVECARSLCVLHDPVAVVIFKSFLNLCSARDWM